MIRRASLLCVLTVCSFLLVLTISKTRWSWYSAPALPLIAVIVALAARVCWTGASSSRWVPSEWAWRAGTLVAAGSVALGVVWHNSAIIDQSPNAPLSTPSAFVRSLLSAHPDLKKVRIVSGGYGPLPYSGPEEFYSEVFRDRDVQVVPLSYAPQPGEIVLRCDVTAPHLADFHGRPIEQNQHCSATEIARP
jgi:hypothetical protein